jgi:hypothetical protein
MVTAPDPAAPLDVDPDPVLPLDTDPDPALPLDTEPDPAAPLDADPEPPLPLEEPEEPPPSGTVAMMTWPEQPARVVSDRTITKGKSRMASMSPVP